MLGTHYHRGKEEGRSPPPDPSTTTPRKNKMEACPAPPRPRNPESAPLVAGRGGRGVGRRSPFGGCLAFLLFPGPCSSPGRCRPPRTMSLLDPERGERSRGGGRCRAFVEDLTPPLSSGRGGTNARREGGAREEEACCRGGGPRLPHRRSFHRYAAPLSFPPYRRICASTEV
jgi:hypothetical protein